MLYQLVAKYYPVFLEHQAIEGRSLPDYVQQEFTDFLKCGRLEYGFLRVRCESCHHEKLVALVVSKPIRSGMTVASPSAIWR